MSADGAFVMDLFARLDGVSARRMFGGLGVYAGGVMFALVTGEGEIFLKADEALKAELAAAGSGPFVWTPSRGAHAGRPVEMSYWRMPESALDDPEDAAGWGRKALAVAQAAAKMKRARKRKRATPPAP